MNNQTAQLLEQHFDTAFAAPDGIKKLRELILTLAMQGKLVAQDPNDPPARELLKEIEAEKRRLVEEGKIKVPKPLPEIKAEEAPYALPETWKWVWLDDVAAKIHYGYTASANHNTQDVRLLRITDIQNNKVDWESVPGCDAKNEDVRQYLLADNDILIARTGGTVGKSYLVQGISVDAVFASYLIRVVPSNRVYARFLKYFAEGPLYWKQLYAACSGTGQPNVNGTSLSQLHLALPPIPEQHRIVAKIDQLMARCDELEKLRAERKQKRLAIHTVALRQLLAVQEQDSSANAWQFLTRHFSELYSVKENVAELRKAILQLAVMGRLVPQDPSDPSANELLERIAAEKQRLVKEKKIKVTNPLSKINMEEEPFALPEGWVWCRFQDVFISIKYGTSKKCEYNGGLIPVLRIPNISNGSVLLDDLKSTDLGSKEVADLSLEKHDILIIRSNGSVSLVGRSAVVDNNAVGFSYAGYLMRIRVFNNQVSSNYLHNVLQSPMTRVAIEGPIRTTSGVKNVNSTEISQLKISLPPLPEQHRIVAKIDKLMALCDTLDQQIDATTGKQTELLNAVMAQV